MATGIKKARAICFVGAKQGWQQANVLRFNLLKTNFQVLLFELGTPGTGTDFNLTFPNSVDVLLRQDRLSLVLKRT